MKSASRVGALWAVWLLSHAALSATPAYAPVTARRPLAFPQDYGSHPEFRIEWWYVTGWLKTQSGEPLGFQITFFRTKPEIDEANPSAFTPHQLLVRALRHQRPEARTALAGIITRKSSRELVSGEAGRSSGAVVEPTRSRASNGTRSSEASLVPLKRRSPSLTMFSDR